MKYFYSCHTDIGTVREVNQDSLVIKSLNQPGHSLLLAAVCDGVGGLSQGEVASRRTAELVSCWFDFELPQILGNGREEETFLNRLRQLVLDINQEIYIHGQTYGVSNGTTLTLLLLWNYRFFIAHVGDSRIYEIGQQVYQMTPDHTWVAREVALGHMTREQARHDARQNIVLQCIGGDREVEPWICSGWIQGNVSYLLCTDGFWHCLDDEEFLRSLSPSRLLNETVIGKNLLYMTEQVKRRGETDNITAIAIHVY